MNQYAIYRIFPRVFLYVGSFMLYILLMVFHIESSGEATNAMTYPSKKEAIDSFLDDVSRWEGEAIAKATRERLFGQNGNVPVSSAFLAIMEARRAHHASSLIASERILGSHFESQRG